MVEIRAPEDVKSPRDRLQDMAVVHSTADWSLATGVWDAHPALLIRWNGDEKRPLGNPVSTGHPTWFVLPEELWWSALGSVTDPEKQLKAIDWLYRNRGSKGAAKG